MKFNYLIKIVSCVIAGLMFCNFSSAAVIVKTVEYKDKNQVYEGLLVTPEGKPSKRPMIVMIHNWMGVTEETKKQASRFAELGYDVFAADIFGKGIRPQDAKSASEQITPYKANRTLFREHLNAGLHAALSQPLVDKKNVAVIGYCFGGTGALELARSGAPLKAIITFHGGLDSPTPADGKNIKGTVLALHGADDPYVPAKDVAAFEEEMKNNGVKYQLIKYPNAVHSFTDVGAGTDNSKGAAYNEAADLQSFEEAKKLLATLLK